jgi:hypothetical protein
VRRRRIMWRRIMWRRRRRRGVTSCMHGNKG